MVEDFLARGTIDPDGMDHLHVPDVVEWGVETEMFEEVHCGRSRVRLLDRDPADGVQQRPSHVGDADERLIALADGESDRTPLK